MEIYPIAIISLIIGFIGLVTISKLLKLSTNVLFLGIFGTIVGLLIGSLASSPLSKLPDPYGIYIPIVVTSISVFGTLVLFLSKKELIIKTLESFAKIIKIITNVNPKSVKQNSEELLLDTSAIIDGRLVDIARSGFLVKNILVPRFVLKELQNIADSEDNIRREKGRRGLELLNDLKKKVKSKVLIIEDEIPDVKEVDQKLVKLAKLKGAKLVTLDYNLNKVARFEGVEVLNINELANALKPVFIPGETMEIKVIQAGKEKGQGVGYLSDGTMIVVEEGKDLLGKKIEVEIKRIFQTDAGKMFFATPIKKNNGIKSK